MLIPCFNIFSLDFSADRGALCHHCWLLLPSGGHNEARSQGQTGTAGAGLLLPGG